MPDIKNRGQRLRAIGLGVAMAAGFAALGGVAHAEAQSEVIYSHKAWEVKIVGFDDGTFSCLAEVTDGSRSFSMWADAAEAVNLQFYDESWDMGEGDTADLSVEVDSRGAWSLTGAELHLQSVFFDIPDSNDGIRFMDEVMGGDTLYLSNATGDLVESYSLAGSRASIGALIECVSALKADQNPFN